MRRFLPALLVLPALAMAQGPNGGSGRPGPDPERAEKRMRLARTVGLAEALDLDTAQALKLGDTMSRFDDRRKAAHKQAMDARDALRNAAQGGKATAADVDGAIGKLLDARAQVQAIDREMLQAVTKDLAPEQKARATLFLGRFRQEIERRMMMRHAPGGMGGPGPGGMGPRGTGGPGWQMHPPQHGSMMDAQPGDDHVALNPGPPDDDAPPFADDLE
ncbi:MAG TPA: hypothetical protein VFG59_05980 [Anaeromyxobacter sp.]|nr:hypothetical protein [Anaeromyxobacter sp.]